ncbi:MAG: iron-containing alcohol dehydrogenase family protein [Limisphaerales bacterium]
MHTPRQIRIPTLVRIKPGALDRVGLYTRRHGLTRVLLLASHGLPPAIPRRLADSLVGEGIEILGTRSIREGSFEQAQEAFAELPAGTNAVLGLGGGKALDTAKYVAFLSRLPYIAIPTSLSNDGFCSPQSSLTLGGRKRSLPSRMPFGVVVDTEVTHAAPVPLWWSGVGDLVSKVTAVHDWRLAFHARGTALDDFAALLSDATVHQFVGRPVRDPQGEALLANALMLNGVAMEVAGSSRPASGSEHLISHALDGLSRAPRLHGLQVGVATYLVSLLQDQGTELISALFESTRFWDAFRDEPLSRREWIEALRIAPALKHEFHTVLSTRDCVAEVEVLLATDPCLRRVFAE